MYRWIYPGNLTILKVTFDLCRAKNFQNSLAGKKHVEIKEILKASLIVKCSFLSKLLG